MNQCRRKYKRVSFKKKCLLGNRFDLIEAQTVEISLTGLGVKTDSTFPFKFIKGCELTVLIPGMEIMDLPQAEIMWTKKDINNTTRLGLKFSTSILD